MITDPDLITESYIQYRLMNKLERLGYKVMSEVKLTLGESRKSRKGHQIRRDIRADIVVMDKKGRLYSAIEVKRKGKKMGDRQSAKYEYVESRGVDFYLCCGIDDVGRVVDEIVKSKAKPVNSLLSKKTNRLKNKQTSKAMNEDNI